MQPEVVVNREGFSAGIRNLLANLYDPAHLQTHPLGESLGLEPSATGSIGERLREIIWEGVESLKPDGNIPRDDPAWLSYGVLSLHYLQALSVDETCRTLGLSARSFRRYQKRGIDAMSDMLWNRFVGAGGSLPGPRQVDDLGAARRFALRSSVEVCQVGELVNDISSTIQPLATELGIDLRFEHVEATVRGDPALLAQVVINALASMLSAAAGSALAIEVRPCDDHLEWFIGRLAPSLAQEALANSREAKVSRVLLDALGGALTLNQQEDGSVLLIRIPTPDLPTVLAVDDDLETTSLYARYLGGTHCVLQAGSVSEALDLLTQGLPRVILLDVLMPHDDGWKMLRELRSSAKTASIPVIVCSVLGQPALALSLGASLVLQKPITREGLVAAIHQVLSPQDSRPLPSP